MRVTAKRRIGALAITGMVIAGVVGVTSMSASGQTAASGVVTASYGTLTINLNDATNTYEAVVTSTNPANVATQVIVPTQPCATFGQGIGDLLKFSATVPTTDTVQVRNNALGVNTGNTSCGSSSAAVIRNNEQLTLQLGTTLTGTQVYVKSARLNLTRLKSGTLKVGFDGLTPVDAGNASPWPQTVPIDAAVITTDDDLFQRISISSTSTKDNEGLSVATGTSFELVTIVPFYVATSCGETVPATIIGVGGAASSAVYQRLDNKTGQACSDVGVTVQIQPTSTATGPSRVFWNNDAIPVNGGSPQRVQAYITIDWAPVLQTAQGQLNRVIDYTGTAATGTAMLWCARNNTATGIPVLPFYNSAGAIDFNPDPNTYDPRAPWCLVEDTRVLADDGKIVQTQKLFGSGDPWAR